MEYIAPRWLPGAHAQTIWPAMIAPQSPVHYRRERWDTPDGDFIDLDFALAAQITPETGADATPSADDHDARPLVALFHGLEGSSASHYATAMCAAAIRRGWRAVVPMFRSCSGELNRRPRAYHSGDSDEIDWILRRLKREHASRAPLFAAGVSLGGNALAKWLGERGKEAGFVAAAAAICAPQDLQAGAQALSAGFSRVYTASFLRTLKRKSLAKLQQYPGLFDRDRVIAADNFFEFDDAVTAPLHGFSSCYDYWTRSSCRQYLPGIEVPTLLINARNDPFVPQGVLATPGEVSRRVRLEYPAKGGHVGFSSASFPGRFDWIPGRVLGYFSEHASCKTPESELIHG